MIARTHAPDARRPAAVVVPRPRPTTEALRPGREDHVDAVAARIVSAAAVVTWIGRLTLLVALGVAAWLVLLP